MVADRTLKPSLTTYDMRPDREEFYKPILETGKDRDESLVAIVEHQVGLAAEKVRKGHFKQALGILQRAAGLARDYGRHAPGEPGKPAAHAALSLIHLQHCVALSRMENHEGAAAQARRSCEESDEVWRLLREASAAEDDAVSAWWEASPDAAGAPEHLKALLHTPPPWLSMIVEASIQGRQCLALELEYQLPGIQAEEEMDALHQEAVTLAGQLLPEDHPVRERASRVQREAEQRQAAQVARAQRKQSSSARSAEEGDVHQEDADETPSGALPPLPLAPRAPAQLPAPGMMLELRQREKKLPWRPAGVQQPQGEAVVGTLGTSDGSRQTASAPSIGVANKDMRIPMSSAQVRAEAPKGDMYYYYTLRRSSPGASPGRSRRRAPRQHEGPLPRAGREENLDPFEDWRRNVVNLNNMTLKQRKLKTDEGRKDLQETLKLQNRRFKQVELKALESDGDRLYENRMFFTHSGVGTRRRAEAKSEAWKKEEWKPTQQAVEKQRNVKELFSFYGVSPAPNSKKGTAVMQSKALRRLMNESVDREKQRQERAGSEDEQTLTASPRLSPNMSPKKT